MTTEAVRIPSQGPKPPLSPATTWGARGGDDLKKSFAATLEGKLVLSVHAQRRMERRNIRLDGPELARIEKAMEAAQRKGVKDSLILLDELALVVSIENRTVITAMAARMGSGKLFTNIDGVVIA